MATLKRTNTYFRLSCLVGVLLSCYALFVELKVEENDGYEAYCDINDYISCSKAFSSNYGRGFGFIASIFGKNSKLNQPNSVSGIVFYLLLLFLSFSEKKSIIKFQIVSCIISNFMSIYLAYILYYVLKDFCIVCVSTYVINAINLVLIVSKWKQVKMGNKVKVPPQSRKTE